MASPLTAEHKAEIERQLSALKDAETEIRRAEAAGIDVAEEKARLTTVKEQLQRIKQAYFPTGRSS